MKSMTGFGRASDTNDTLLCNIELSSVNRKQCEVVVQLPKKIAELEPTIRKTIVGNISRGRINVSISLEANGKSAPVVQIDTQKAKALSEALGQLSQDINQPLNLSASDILRTQDIITFTERDIDTDGVSTIIQTTLQKALEQLIKMRSREGEDLKTDAVLRLNKLIKITSEIESHAPGVIERYRKNLMRRLAETNLEIDLGDERILKEIGIFAEKCDISEEITRLRSHFDKFFEYLTSDDPVGRSLDFMCQEINREFNTIGSKANDAGLAQFVVSAKTELEKVREQIQNVE